ncbi:MAG: succinate-semialdehyde dehydrogenase (NADP(+)) [Bifidobacteriaceae bacterium]|jgi:succinate-semialdehyde dehydrogenase/glutarate-semialdehyde dehydrogenase|nr:succinate-semialdehyde dehydrogenase (NADP(+)) [Bifidobacteriaceae bacterium]
MTTASTETSTDSGLYRIDPDWRHLAGEVTRCAARATRAIRSPIDGAELGEVPVCEPEDVREAGRRAGAAGRRWAGWSVGRRCGVIERFKDLLVENRDDLLDLVHAENGKSRTGAFEEFLDAVLTAGYYAAKAPKVLRRHRRQGALPVLTSTYVHYVPKGVVGVIAPWNYPLTLAVSDAVPALLAGNGVILKPDSATPLTALYLVGLLRQAGLPKDVLQVVTGPGSELGLPIIDASQYLMFTGSTATGRTIAAQCGERLIGCSAELGGKNALLVLEDAPLRRTVEGAVQACFANTGQLCIAVERIYVARPLFEEFAGAFAARTASLVLGGSGGWQVDLGPLVSQAQLDKTIEHVDDAVSKGATVLTGGQARPDLGAWFYEPTVLTGVTDAMTVARDETFGPVVSLYPVDSDSDAIAAVNDSEYGLNASIWTSSPAHGRAVGEQLRAGTVNINEGYAAAWGSTDAPMGGFGISGLGRRHGIEGLVKYTEPQTVATERWLAVGPPPWLSRQAYAAGMTVGSRWLHVTAGELIRKATAL